MNRPGQQAVGRRRPKVWHLVTCDSSRMHAMHRMQRIASCNWASVVDNQRFLGDSTEELSQCPPTTTLIVTPDIPIIDIPCCSKQTSPLLSGGGVEGVGVYVRQGM